ncbi:unnamed protein product [Psylliodes chrysocephalus]|uniref:Uncharacterized protein n=1 Tax=Psylliodes chrysocephalus TaxID=3402493 RepID=A0A9P0GC37_9CUCU|nr:unnamed protein product [Psylliodes chrysocephala]CAH1105533.1 unnamed protein product [Psylliodes chrysocephala]
MKGFIVFVAVAISLVYADEGSEKRAVIRRVTREAISGMGGVFLKQTEKNVIYNCKANGLSYDGAESLQNTFDKMTQCMSSPRIFSVPKAEYIDNIVSCSKQAITETKDCLPEEQKYFPEFVLDLAKSLVSFMYDDKPVLASPEIPRCMKNFIRSEVQQDYIGCMTTVAAQTHDTQEIPKSKAEFCSKFLPAGNCFPKTLNKYCSNDSKVQKFTSDYTRALEQPCETKEQ